MKVLIFSIVGFIAYVIINAISSEIVVKKFEQEDKLNEERLRRREEESLWEILRHRLECELAETFGSVLDAETKPVNPASYVGGINNAK